MFSTRRMFLVLVAAMLLVSCCNVAFAAVTGKISGYIVDKKTQEGLPSVAVQIVGTTRGAMTSPDGSYLIMNIPPGTYSLKVRLIGYQTVQVDKILVITDRTADVSVEMKPAAVETGIVQRIVAKRDIMEMKKPTSNVVITREQMEVMPVLNVEDILAATVGVVRRYGELHIRGGRSGEVSYVVDGVETKDPLGGLGPTDAGMNLSSNSIEEIQIIKGGYDPEYGRAMSGIVTINTRTGGKTGERYIELYTDNFGDENLNKYSENFSHLYFSTAGPEPFLAGKLLPALGIDYFRDKLFYFFSVDTWKTNTAYSYNDYVAPKNQRQYREHDILGLFTLADRQRNSFQLQGNMVYEMTNNMRLVFNYSGTWDDATRFRWYYRDTPSSAPIGNDLTERFSATVTHQINKTTFYEFLVSRVYHEYVQKPDDPNNPGVGLSPDDFRFEDEWESYDDMNQNGVYDIPEPFINVYADTSYEYGGQMYNFGDVFIPDTNANIVFSMDNTRAYNLYDPWYQDPIRYDIGMMYWDGEDFVEAYVEEILWDWNGDGLISYEESEPFVDLNNNGRWDRGDRVRNDQNGNGLYDEALATVAGYDRMEPYVDGDINLGEPFFDYNNDGVYQPGIDGWVRAVDPQINQDLNRNSQYDGPDSPWGPGIPYQDLNGNGIYDAPNNRYDIGEPFVDVNGNGKWNGTDQFLDRGYDARTSDGGTYYHESSSETWTADFKITKQLVKEHELKSGVQVKFLDLKYAELLNPWIRNEVDDGGRYVEHGIERDFYDHDPIEGAFFLQDVIEYGSLVARVGFRYDFFFQSGGVDSLAEAYGEEGKKVIDNRSKMSPRIGISYPITDRAKIYFNYGHFYQLPYYVNMYRRLGFSTGRIGNPNLDFEKTVQYEFGVRYNISGDYVLDIAGFYKDIFGMINTQKVRFGQELYQYANSDYGRSRGFEIQFEKKYGDYIAGYANYTYAFAYGKASSELSNYEILVQNREIPIQEFPLDWDIRHAFTLNFDLRITQSDHPKLFGYSIPNDWGINILWQIFSGAPFTPASGYPNLRLTSGERVLTNSLRYPSTSEMDVRFNKNFSLWNIDYTFELWVNNVFDTENINTLYSETGRPDTHNNVGEIIRGDTDYYQNPANYDPGRNIRVGFTMHF